MQRCLALSSVVGWLLLAATPFALADDVHATDPAKVDRKAEVTADAKADVKPEQSITQHRITMRSGVIDYTATAGTLILRDDDDKPIASMSYVAYVKNGVKDPGTRPVMFAFNGGPGSSSMWLHMGGLGPRRVVTTDAGPTPPAPYQVVDNQHGVLDRTDIVFIDPVGTGLSRAAGEKKDEDFWGVDPDIDSVARFIAQYVSDTGRWNSPKYLLGESYGTTRGTAIVNLLQQRRSMLFNGLILVSVATDIGALDDNDSDRPFPLFLPTLAATSWYHGVTSVAKDGTKRELRPWLDAVRLFAAGPYTTALLAGAALPAAQRDAIAQQLSEYTGLSVEYLLAANLRVTDAMYEQELLRSSGRTVGRIDSRFVGMTRDLLSREAEYDTQASAISGAFTAAFLDYYQRDLKFGQGKTYRITNYAVGDKWKWEHKAPGGYTQQMVNSSPDLGSALVFNPSLQVLVLNGYLDLATPFFGAEWMLTHLAAPAAVQQRIHMKYYEAGHMMYLHPASLELWKADLDAFFAATRLH